MLCVLYIHFLGRKRAFGQKGFTIQAFSPLEDWLLQIKPDMFAVKCVKILWFPLSKIILDVTLLFCISVYLCVCVCLCLSVSVRPHFPRPNQIKPGRLDGLGVWGNVRFGDWGINKIRWLGDWEVGGDDLIEGLDLGELCIVNCVNWQLRDKEIWGDRGQNGKL